MKRTVTPI